MEKLSPKQVNEELSAYKSWVINCLLSDEKFFVLHPVEDNKINLLIFYTIATERLLIKNLGTIQAFFHPSGKDDVNEWIVKYKDLLKDLGLN